MAKKRLPGTIYLNNGRYWWKVKFEGDKKFSYFPLKPVGARFATKDIGTARIIAQEMLTGLQTKNIKRPQDTNGKISNIINHYLVYAKAYYGDEGEKHAGHDLVLLNENFGDILAEDFTSLDFQRLIEALVDTGLARKTINDRIGRVKRLFKWAANQMLIPRSTYDSVALVDRLKKNRAVPRIDDPNETIRAKETGRKRLVPVDIVEKTLPHLSNVVAAMARLQLVTGMRSTEICIMRPCDIDRKGEVWVYTPKNTEGLWDYKTQWREESDVEKEICLGPKAQKIVEPFLFRGKTEYLFKPSESEADHREKKHKNRKTPMMFGNKPGTNNKGIRKFNECFSRDSYRRAITRACEQAFPPPEHLRQNANETKRAFNARLTEAEKTELKAWNKKHAWHPHQLRHTATTLITRELGQDHAQAYIGHSDKAMTALYSRDATLTLAKAAALEVG